ncbi:MAG: transporter [Lachnospiraceae bacterium]|jgi:drug/metabolite transporter (DMT)-like permease
MEEKNQKKRLSAVSILIIQGAVIIYTLSSIFSKLSSNYEVMSPMFIVCIGLEVLALGVYAIFWQQIIKRFDLSLAYANRASAIFWSMIWAALLFGEEITLKNIIGVIVIFAGIMLVNSDAA